MSSAAKVRDLIKEIGHNVQFTTAQLLCCGSRNAVDIELCRLVANGIIRRLAAGVFIVCNSFSEIPTAFEIAKTKALRFGKRLVQPNRTAAQSDENNFYTNGCRSSFKSVHGRLHFKHIAPRKWSRSNHSTNTPALPRIQAPEADEEASKTASTTSDITLKLVQIDRDLHSLSSVLMRLFIILAGKRKNLVRPISYSHNGVVQTANYSRAFLN